MVSVQHVIQDIISIAIKIVKSYQKIVYKLMKMVTVWHVMMDMMWMIKENV